MDYAPLVAAAAQQFNVDPALIHAVIQTESGGNPNAVGPTTPYGKPVGLGQFIAPTAKALGITDPTDPTQAIPGIAHLLSQNIDHYGNVPDALRAYYGGTDKSQWGPKTQAYVGQVASHYQPMTAPQPAAPSSGLPPIASDRGAPPDPFAGLTLQNQPTQAPVPDAPDPFAGLTLQNQQQASQSTAPDQIERHFNLGKTASPPAAPANAQQPTFWDQLTRQLGLTARAGVTGVTGFPAVVGNALNSGVNLGISGINQKFGTHIPQLGMPTDAIQQGMTAMGIPQPQTPTERIVGDVTSSLASVPLGIGGGSLLAKSANPLFAAVGQGMQALPGMQLTGAAGAGLAGGLARENGVGPLGQFGYSALGGLAGAVAPSAALAIPRAAAGLAHNIAGAVQPFSNPEAYVGKQLANYLSPDAAAIAENIRNAPEFVPQSFPTTAQVGATPALVATEKALANRSPAFKIALAQRETDNNAARWQTLTDVAGTNIPLTPEGKTALEVAQDARTAAATPLYDAAHQNTANVGRAFLKFEKRPAVQQAMQQADILARNEGVTLKWNTPGDRAISGQALDYTSRALGDMIDAAKRSGQNQQARALIDAQSYLQNWTSQYVPGVREAASVYAQKSVPVNTMEAAQQISDSLGTRAMGPGGIAQLQLMPYRTALRQALKGQKYGIDPDALAALQGIGQDLQRATISNSLRSAGSDTAYNISANGWLAKQMYGQNFGGAGNAARGIGALGALITGHPMIGASILVGGKKLGSLAGNRLDQQLGELLLNPAKAAPYLDAAAQASQQGTHPALPLLRSYVNQGLLGASIAQGSNQ